MSMRAFERSMEKTKQSNGKELYFYTIPSGFKNNNELLEYFIKRRYRTRIIDSNDVESILHLSW